MKRAVRLLLLIALRVLAVGVVMLWATARLGTLSVAVPVGSRAFGFATTTNGLIVGTEPADGATQSSWRFRSYLAAVDETRVTMQSVLGNGGNVVETFDTYSVGNRFTIACLHIGGKLGLNGGAPEASLFSPRVFIVAAHR